MRCIDADALIADLEHDVAIDQDTLDYEELTEINRANIQFDKDCKQNAIDLLKNAPTIEPKPKWILCSETVDIPDHEIMACDKYGEIMFGYLAYEDEQWICASDECVMYDQIAWREKPEPYRKEGD